MTCTRPEQTWSKIALHDISSGRRLANVVEANSKHFMFNEVINARNSFNLDAFLLFASVDIPQSDSPLTTSS
jgi:hypothetical protein